jgi:hypothetical protein
VIQRDRPHRSATGLAHLAQCLGSWDPEELTHPGFGTRLLGAVVLAGSWLRDCASVPDLRISSLSRTTRLSNDETVKLGRALAATSSKLHVSFPDDGRTVMAIVHDYVGPPPSEAEWAAVASVLGTFVTSYG